MSKIEIRRIIGNQDVKIGTLEWEQHGEYDDVEYLLSTINKRLDADNMPDGYGIYMMQKDSKEEFKHPKQKIDDLHRPVLKIPIDNLQYVDALREGQAFLMIEKEGKTWVWDGMIMEG